MLQHMSYTEEDREKITDAIRAIAEFEQGDRVTVEPADTDFAYYGQEYEGVPLVVKDVFWRGNDLHPVRPESRQDLGYSDYGEEHYVELEGDYETYAWDKILITSVEYEFDVEGAYGLSESSLIPWDEYLLNNDEIFLPSESENETISLRPADTPCEVCGCNLIRHAFMDNGVVTAGRETCPACGDVKAEHTP